MIQDYFQKSKSPFYSFVITLPIFLIYALGLFLMRGTEFNYIKNGADVLIENAISTLGFDIFYISSSLFLIAFFTIKSFLQFVEKIGMTPFVLYRVALGLVLLLI